MRPGEPVAIRDIKKSSSWASSISCGPRPALRPPFSWQNPQPFPMKASEPRSICAALSPTAGAGVCWARLAGTEMQPQAATKQAKPATRQKPIRRFIVFTNRNSAPGLRSAKCSPLGRSNTDRTSQRKQLRRGPVRNEFRARQPRRNISATIRVRRRRGSRCPSPSTCRGRRIARHSLRRPGLDRR
jgi:hypothetical protein